MGYEASPGGECIDEFGQYLQSCKKAESDMNFARLTHSPEQLEMLRQDLTEKLDAECPYMQDFVHIRGMALMPRVDREEESFETDAEDFSMAVLIDRSDEETVYGMVHGVTGMFHGAYIRKPDETCDEYVVTHFVKIGIKTYSLAKGTRTRHETLFGYFDLDSSIVLVDEVESSLLGRSPIDFVDSSHSNESLNYFSAQLVKLFRSNTFRRQSLPRQKSALEHFIRRAEVDSGVADKSLSIEFAALGAADRPKARRRSTAPSQPYGYVPHLLNGEQRLKKVKLLKPVLGGTCIGLATAESPHLRSRPYRALADFRDPRAGLNLVIDLEDEAHNAVRENILYVPISSQDFDTILY